MGKVFLEITMSLDGFVAGPDITLQDPMGKEGPQLHDWMFGAKTDADNTLITELINNTGAVILGNYTYTTAIIDAWGNASPFASPAFVVCTKAPSATVQGFTYITDGLRSALDKAKAAAGAKDVWIMGGAYTAQQFLQAGLIDELHIHIAPVLLARGRRLFEYFGPQPINLKKIKTIDTPGAVHIRFQVIK
jgi:dihydrofolate reductase